MFERFTERARQVVVLAQEEARRSSTTTSAPSTSCSGCCARRRAWPRACWSRLDITVERVRAQVVRIVGSGEEVTSGQIPFTPRAKKVLELALREALSPRAQLHRHRAHPARPGARERGRRRAHPARLRRRLGEDPQRGDPHALRPRRSPPGAGLAARAARAPARLARRGQEVLEAARPVRAQPDEARRRGQARPGRRPRDGDRADHADPLAPHEEQPRADRRARRGQDRRGRGPRPADHRTPTCPSC